MKIKPSLLPQLESPRQLLHRKLSGNTFSQPDSFIPRFRALVTKGDSNTYLALKAKIVELAKEYDAGTDELRADAAHQTMLREVRALLTQQFGTDFQENSLLQGAIPPALHHKASGERTNRALALTLIDFIRFLSKRLVPENGEDAKMLVLYATLVLSGRAMRKGSNAWSDDTFKATYDFTQGITYIRSSIAGFEQDDNTDKIQCSFPTRHFVFFGPNGAIQILQQPTAAEMVHMIESDPDLQAKIRTETPLPRYIPMVTFEHVRSFPPKLPGSGKGLSYEETMALLKGTLELNGQAVTLKDREFPSRWSDRHTLLHYLTFDIARYLREGIWKPQVVLNLPGRDGRSVWGDRTAL